MNAPSLVRQHFSVSRSAEYFRAAELQAQTGQPVDKFAHVALKELVDNALDAAETAGVSPLIQIEFEETEDEIVLTVADNGLGIEANVVERILDFTMRTSDKAAYRAPTRGHQGNALKTLLGIPVALGAGKSCLTIEGAGTRHEIAAWITPAGEVKTEHVQDIGPEGGARISITMPRDGLDWNLALWAFRFALFNPVTTIPRFLGICHFRRPKPSRAAGGGSFSQRI
jgi:Histidine kinase-, DNA gyrase B-, and HSP90-like ATPase